MSDAREVEPIVPAPGPAAELYASPLAEPAPASEPERDTSAPLPLLESLRVAAASEVGTRLERFLNERRAGRALAIWLDGFRPQTRADLARRLSRDIAQLDEWLNDQLNAILHHPRLQQLEASWRGLRYLVDKVDQESDRNLRIRVLNVAWRELERDFEKATDFDQSQLFHKVYSEEFGMPGGTPYGVLLADYQVRLGPQPGHPHDDLSVVRALSQVAAAAFCPLIVAAHPALFSLESFSQLEHQLDHAATFNHLDYLKWRALRESEDSRFLGVVLPRVLMRRPYEDDGTRVDRFLFREQVTEPDRQGYLWGNAVYAYGGVLIRSFATSGWLADIRGTQRGQESGGLVTGLPVHTFSTDKRGLIPRISTEVVVTDELERRLADLGFLALSPCKDTEYSAFYTGASLQQPKKYDRQAATLNARVSAMLSNMLCASRFAHYIKVIARDKVGQFSSPADLQVTLQRWIAKYVTNDPGASPAAKAKYPLRQAEIEVRELPGKPGAFHCLMHLAPHYQLDELAARIRVVTELAPPRTV